MSDLRELYQEVILDHYRQPRNFAALDDADRKAEGYNPLCGDRVTVYLRIDGDVVTQASFQGAGCAISTASASLMTEAIQGKTLAEVEALFEQFHHLVTGTTGAEGGAAEDLGKLEVLGGVRDYPVRVKCATLAWHTLHSALEKRNQTASTE
ncbi:MAG: SUF system NifU family Fe-S cluster assembly protein [Thermoanaerobaculia bacterium]|nr:SUF system NifU family Fe-S cluster assembly protein [Thermoanaerobaculia bacterium]